MKKLLLISLSALLFSCGGGDPNPDPPEPPEPPRDTETVWLGKLSTAVNELESIAIQTNAILEDIEGKFFIYNRDPTTIDIIKYIRGIYDSEEYTTLEQDINGWKDKHKLNNYPLSHEQTYNQANDLHSKCFNLFKQTNTLYARFWPIWEELSDYVNYNNQLYNEILQQIASIEQLFN